MTLREVAEEFELPEHCTHEHVVIYESDAHNEPPYRATPFDYVGDSEQGTGYYEEPEDYEITEAYREAVAERASIDISDIELSQPPTVEDVEPI